MGQLILQGIPPYSEAYNMKFPGTYLMYALIMSLFGQTVHGIHLGFMIVNCAAIILVYSLAKKMIGDFGAVIAGGTYAVLSLNSSVLGFAAHATHFVVLPAVAGALLLFTASKKNKWTGYLWSGALFGLAFVMKQPGFFFVLFGALFIIYRYVSFRPAHPVKRFLLYLTAFTIGAAAPLVVTFIWLYFAGVFDKFWFWTFDYASKYGSQIPLSGAFSSFKSSFPDVADDFVLLWGIGVLGFLVTLFRRDSRDNRVFMILFAVTSLLTVCPGFYFRQHYFVTFLPAVSVLVGSFFDYFDKKGAVATKSRYIKIVGSGIFLAIILFGVISQRGYFFGDDPVRLSRGIFETNPFPECVEIAKFIKANSSATDRVAVLGSEPQIFFYSGRRSATGYIYTYSLMEKHDYALSMQKEMAKEIEASNPKFIVLVNVYFSWLSRQESERFIFGWSDNYIRGNYVLAGVADIISPEMTVYRWGDDARNYAVRSPAHLLVFERRR
jgi:hypothetical protein